MRIEFASLAQPEYRQAVQPRIEADITSLDQLCRALNDGQTPHITSGTLCPQSPAAGLPTFSSVPPPNLAGIWSWDATRMLLVDSEGRFFIEPRDPEIWYPNEKALPST